MGSSDETNELGKTTQLDAVAATLQKLRFLNTCDDPLIPGIAKFFHVNSLGHVPVWPRSLAYKAAASKLSSAAIDGWQRNPGDLVFVLPHASGRKTAHALAQYGSEPCSRVARGGGPILLRSS